MPSATEPLAVDLRHVTKHYGRRVCALAGITMRVRPGEIFGLLGPNGAGKSTLVKIMTTVVRPNRAEGTILGRPIGHRPTLARLGYLPEHLRFPPYLTGRQALEYYAALAKVDRPTRKRRAMKLLELVRMKDWANARIGTYSKGMQQRVALAQALVNDPDLVVLDEPTDGLDPVGRRETREILRQIRQQGKTVFLNSHLRSEVEMVCDRVAILVGGRVVSQGTIEELTAGSRHYEIELEGTPGEKGDRSNLPRSGPTTLRAVPGASHKLDLSPFSGAGSDAWRETVGTALGCRLQVDSEADSGAIRPAGSPPEPVYRGKLPSGQAAELQGRTLRIRAWEAAAIQPVIDALRAGRLVIQSVRPVQQSLEDFFVEVVSDGQSPLRAVGAVQRGGRP